MMSEAREGPVDALVVGGGMAGLAAAGVLAGQGHSVTIVDEYCAGGRLLGIGPVLDFPGIGSPISGPELAARCTEAILDLGVNMVPSRVVALQNIGRWRAETYDGAIEASAVIVATGRAPDLSVIPGAEEFAGRGISYCATCDGPLFAGARVVVAGSSWWLSSEVEHLARLAELVTVLAPGDRPPGLRRSWERVAQQPNVEVVVGGSVKSLEPGSNGLEGVVVRLSDGGEQRLAARALFLCDEELPVVLPGVPCELIDGEAVEFAGQPVGSASSGLFTAGAVRSRSVPYLISAATDGTRAAMFACSFLASR